MTAQPQEHLVITAVGPDRVGLVEKISELLVQEGCNIEDSKMAVFCGEFAIIVLVSGDATALQRVGQSLDSLTAQTGLTFFSKKPAARVPVESALPCRLLASCLDHPGVVHQLSSVLSRLGVNIESLETKTQEASMSGTPIFQLDARLSVPARVNLHELRRDLDEIARRENIDIEFSLLPKA
ncbi:MAG: ACT domain-containing protein [Acidobacteria bacterium]|nr:ACT domain-containing protein [Acidobacteriota bacterium]